jgi:hypothetical protein
MREIAVPLHRSVAVYGRLSVPEALMRGWRKTVADSSKLTPCLALLARAFAGSHSKSYVIAPASVP